MYKYDGDSAIIAFHCQQAIEKALKAFLLKKDGRLRVGHSLLYLLQEASKYNNDFMQNRKECAMVNQYYIETRYPAEEPLDVSREIAEECIQIASTIINLIENILGLN